MAGVKIPISADFNSGDLDKAVQQFSSQMNRLAKSIAEANNAKFNPIDDATADDIKKVIQQFEALKRLSESFNKRLKDTGQANISLFDIDFHKLYENQRAGARKALDVLQYVTAGTTFASRMPRPTADNQGSSRLPAQVNGSPATIGWKQAGSNVFHSAMSAAGPGGQVIGNAVSAGMSGGLKAGLFGLAGGAAALGIGSLISSTRERIGEAQQEAVGYDHLKRALGDVTVNFKELRDSLRFAADEIWETYGKAQELSVEFARISGLSRDQSRNLSKEVAFSGGFSWSLGLDTRQGNQFFAQMRQFKVTNSDSDTRRFALLIGEGIARGGAFAKADELMQAIAGFTANQARTSLVTPNVAGYTNMLSGMVGSGVPGLDPQGAASLLGRVNSAIMQGGAAGESGQNLLYAAIGRRLGLNPVETLIMQQNGMFATAKNVFGSQLAKDFYGMNRMSTPHSLGSDKTVFQMAMEHLGNNYADRPFLKLDAMSNLFSINHSQAMALDVLHRKNPAALGGMIDRLGRLNIDIDKISATGMTALADIEHGDKHLLEKYAKNYRDRQGKDKLTAEEHDKLNSAQLSGDIGVFRDVLTEIAAKRGMEETEGSKTQRLLSESHNELQKLSSGLIGPIDTMKEGVLALVKRFTGRDIRKEQAAAKAAEDMVEIKKGLVAEQYPSNYDQDRPMSQFRFGGNVGAMSSSGPATGGSGIFELPDAEMEKRKQAILAQLPADLRKRIEDDPIFQMQVAKESGWRHRDKHGNLIVSPKGAIGLAQVLKSTALDPGYYKYGATSVKRAEDIYDLEENIRTGLNYSQALRRYAGDDVRGLAMYNMGEGNLNSRGGAWWEVDETRNYVTSVMAGANRPVPEGTQKWASHQQNASIEVNMKGTIHDSGHKQIGHFEPVKTRVGAPRASGSFM
nr:lytic transglycosylase domain-containing protein [Nitrosomonas nitrosa]